MLKFKNHRQKITIILLSIFAITIIITILIFVGLKSQKSSEISDDSSAEFITEPEVAVEEEVVEPEQTIKTAVSASNCTTNWGELMLINPVFSVDTDFIARRKNELIDIETVYGIHEGNAYNGAPLLDATAAAHLNEMISAYQQDNPGHTMTTRSCFRSVGTQCGRLCYATGTSDHHTGFTCDLVDDYYGDTLDTDYYDNHPDWQWLHANSYKYGFIDRFIEEWAGGSMLEPVNINEEGSTGLFETWHYRYVGIKAATEIASGAYNNGNYDSLEHYLKATGRLTTLTDMASSCNY